MATLTLPLALALLHFSGSIYPASHYLAGNLFLQTIFFSAEAAVGCVTLIALSAGVGLLGQDTRFNMARASGRPMPVHSLGQRHRDRISNGCGGWVHQCRGVYCGVRKSTFSCGGIFARQNFWPKVDFANRRSATFNHRTLRCVVASRQRPNHLHHLNASQAAGLCTRRNTFAPLVFLLTSRRKKCRPAAFFSDFSRVVRITSAPCQRPLDMG